MIVRPEITAVIVARAGSVRIPSKSLLKLNGDTLIERKIKQLKKVKSISRIVFGSNSMEMLDIASAAGVETVVRPDFFCDESKASANDMIGNMMNMIKTDHVIWTHCTNPLLSEATYQKAIDVYLSNCVGEDATNDSLLSVVRFQEHLWGTDKKPLNYNPYAPRHVPARELPAYFMQDGGIFIQPYNQMKKNSYFFGKKPILFEIPKEEFLDINETRDYWLAKAIIEHES